MVMRKAKEMLIVIRCKLNCRHRLNKDKGRYLVSKVLKGKAENWSL